MLNDVYVAGLFDGEGYVGVQSHRRYPSIVYQIRVTLGVTYAPVITMLQATYGGSIHVNRHSTRNPRHKDQHVWVAGSQIACSFLKKVLPHLIIKQEQAKLALELQASIDKWKFKFPGKHPQRERIFAHREDLVTRITALKHVHFSIDRGPSESVDSY